MAQVPSGYRKLFSEAREKRLTMAVMRIWPVRGRIDHPIDYAMNPDKTIQRNPPAINESLQDVMQYAVNGEKTEERFFVSGINCNPETACNQFITVKKQFGKEGGIIAYHGYQSFAKDEVTPEIAHKIGTSFAEKVWGENYQVVVATHLNTGCLHNHFVVNSVSYRHGRRCREKQWRELSKISDELCRAYKLSVVEKPLGKRLPIPVAHAEREGKPTRLVMARQALDEALAASCSLHDLEKRLRAMGYQCQLMPQRQFWTIKQKNWQRPIRLVRLGDGYDKEGIMERLRANLLPVRMEAFHPGRGKKRQYHLRTRNDRVRSTGGLRGIYLYYCYRLGYLPKYRQNPNHIHYLLRDDLLKLEHITEEVRFLGENGIETGEQLAGYKKNLTRKMELLTGQRNIHRNVLRRKSASPSQKEEAKEQINKINATLKKIRKEIRLCESIERRSPEMERKLQSVEREEQKKERGGRE